MKDRPLKDIISDTLWNKYCSIDYKLIGTIPCADIFRTISIVTTCMNRLEDLKQTYLLNIGNNQNYPNIEFVLLNYNSQDGLDKWVKENLQRYIDWGILHYYKTTEPQHYSMSHSRNVAFRLATGDVVSSVDADHILNEGFAFLLNNMAEYYGPKSVFVKSRQKNRGRITMFRKNFIELGGYDEELHDYGWEDQNLLDRANLLGYSIVRYGGQWGGVVENHKRHRNMNYTNNDWRYTQERNALLGFHKLYSNRVIANKGYAWGQATVCRDFSNEKLDSSKLA